MVQSFGPFTLSSAAGIGHVVFDRAPVNAFALSTYAALGELIDRVEQDDDVKVVVLSAPATMRSWCGGADLNDFVGMDRESRYERYAFINETIPRFAALQRPVIAAITGHAIGIGVMLAACCDLRIASESAFFSTPEIDYGLVAGSSRMLNHLGLSEARIREMAYTGRRYSAAQLQSFGFLNDVVAAEAVVPTALELAATIAAKSLPALRARKQAFVQQEGLSWLDGYLLAQGLTGTLVELNDSRDGVNAFFEHRQAAVTDT
ncbi:MAG: enoyl-CoA hydratase/isomerase family protein [Subtercola sp.]|nr:enoyl-CoA hydratase/isomerase family protein [Subtercola sp.]